MTPVQGVATACSFESHKCGSCAGGAGGGGGGGGGVTSDVVLAHTSTMSQATADRLSISISVQFSGPLNPFSLCAGEHTGALNTSQFQ